MSVAEMFEAGVELDMAVAESIGLPVFPETIFGDQPVVRCSNADYERVFGLQSPLCDPISWPTVDLNAAFAEAEHMEHVGLFSRDVWTCLSQENSWNWIVWEWYTKQPFDTTTLAEESTPAITICKAILELKRPDCEVTEARN